jgi:pimeloyl-ACP methyl ester carboxylesterase
MFTSDRRTRVMRSVLFKAGYDVHGWERGRHMPGGDRILTQLSDRLDDIGRTSGAPVTLVGWSLGGLVAREYAKRDPSRVASVITLGSPFSGNPRHNRAWRLWEFAARQKIEDSPFGKGLGVKPPVDTTAIWSARDGIIPPAAARGLDGERDREIEVDSGHFAMACAPSPLVALLRVLRENPLA